MSSSTAKFNQAATANAEAGRPMAVACSDLFDIPMRPWEKVEPDMLRSSKAHRESQDNWTLRTLYGTGARGKSRRELINALVRRDVRHALEAWSRDVSAGRKVNPNAI